MPLYKYLWISSGRCSAAPRLSQPGRTNTTPRFWYSTRWSAPKDPLTGKKDKTPWLLRDRYVIARDLHRRLYTAIAAGDRETIEKIACTGLKRELQIKLDQRKALKAPAETWNIEYKGLIPTSEKTPWLISAFMPPILKSTQMLADRFAPLPVGQEASLRQLFVRIRSKQTLDRNDGKGAKTVDRSEIVVVQQMRMDGEEDEWKIWGTTEATKGEKLDEMLEDATGAKDSFVERVKDKLMGMATKEGSGPTTGL